MSLSIPVSNTRERPARRAWRINLRFNLVFGGLLFALAVFVGLFADLLAHTDPVMDANLLNSEEPPSWKWWFGTDAQGRDIYSRVVHGARISLTVGIVSQFINSIIGVSLGLTAGYFGGWWDDLVNGLTNLMLAIPSLIFALAIMAILGPGLGSLLIALGLTNWSFTCRIARASVLSLKSQGYVQAARVLGYSHARIMITQLLPNMLGPIIVIGTLGMGGAVLAEASLSFLGLGVRPPYPSWGSMLSEAREQITTAPWLSVFPGLAIFLTVLGLNLLGDGLRDILDPQSRSTRV
jgi:peptide/nickel transport system permease protein